MAVELLRDLVVERAFPVFNENQLITLTLAAARFAILDRGEADS